MYNTKTKIYTDGSSKSIYCDSSIFSGHKFRKSSLSKFKSPKRKRRSNRIQKFSFDLETKYSTLRTNMFYILPWVPSFVDGYLYSFGRIYNNLDNWQYVPETDLNNVCSPDLVDSKFISYKEYLKKSFTRSNGDKVVRSDSVKRAKDSIFDYVMNNPELDYFFTFTIDPSKYNRNDASGISKLVQDWLGNTVRSTGMSYLMITERHKDGGIHFHGLMSIAPEYLVDSGTKKYGKMIIRNEKAVSMGLKLSSGRTIYNFPLWADRFGHTNIMKVQGERSAVAYYITKYITKDSKMIFGKFYWHSRDLKKPKIGYYNVNYDELTHLKEYSNVYQKCRYEFVSIKKHQENIWKCYETFSTPNPQFFSSLMRYLPDIDMFVNPDTGELIEKFPLRQGYEFNLFRQYYPDLCYAPEINEDFQKYMSSFATLLPLGVRPNECITVFNDDEFYLVDVPPADSDEWVTLLDSDDF